MSESSKFDVKHANCVTPVTKLLLFQYFSISYIIIHYIFYTLRLLYGLLLRYRRTELPCRYSKLEYFNFKTAWYLQSTIHGLVTVLLSNCITNSAIMSFQLEYPCSNCTCSIRPLQSLCVYKVFSFSINIFFIIIDIIYQKKSC